MDDDGPQDQNLLERAKAGDQAAWRDLIRRFRSYLRPLVVPVLRNDDAVEQLLQDTIAIVHRELEHFRGEASLLTWAASIALKNATKVSVRTKRRQQALDRHESELPGLGELPLDPERCAAAREALRALNESLPLLSKRDRELVTDPLDDDDDDLEGAPAPASPATRTARSRARARLRDLMEGRENR